METTSSGLPAKDVEVVRGLAARVAELAALPVQQERIRQWQALNGLRPERPMAMIDEIPWHELAGDVPGGDELVIASAHPFTSWLETELRRTLYRWNHVRVDMVVEPYVDVKKVIDRPGWGIRITEDTIDQGGAIQSHHYADQLANPEDVEKFRVLEPSLDVERTAEREAWARECLDGLLEVRMQGLTGYNGDELAFPLWDDIEQYRGTEPILYDFVDRPEHLHAIADRLTEVRLAELDILEAKGLLGYGNDRIHCTGAHTTELPKAGFDPAMPAHDRHLDGRPQPAVRVGLGRRLRRVRAALLRALVRAVRPRLLRLLRSAPQPDRLRPQDPERAQDLDEPLGEAGEGCGGHRPRLRLQPQAQPGDGRDGHVGPGDRREGLRGRAGGDARQRLPGRVHAQGHQHLPVRPGSALGVVRDRGADDPGVGEPARAARNRGVTPWRLPGGLRLAGGGAYARTRSRYASPSRPSRSAAR